MKKKIIIAVIIILVLFPIIWYLASPLFINKKVNEEFPSNTQIENENAGTNEQNEIQNLLTMETIYQGDFQDADSFHKVSGEAKVISDKESLYLRLENFKSTNGPDLKVYLAEDTNANSYISLGPLKGNIGNQNYEIKDEIDFDKYQYALIWCERFSVLFGYAKLSKSQN